MHLQNRVSPLGQLHAIIKKGRWMSNLGRLHDADIRLIRAVRAPALDQLRTALQGAQARTLEMAIARHQPQAEVLLHSDRGSQNCAYDYQALLWRHRIVPSNQLRNRPYTIQPARQRWRAAGIQPSFRLPYILLRLTYPIARK